MKVQTLEALMNQSFRKAQVEDRHVLVKEFTMRSIPMIEIYELIDDEWKQNYYGETSYVKKYIVFGETE